MQNINLDKVQYVLFDWDGTLADTRECHIVSINEVLTNYNLPDWSEVKKLRDTSLSLKNNFSNIFGSNAQAAFQEYSLIYRKNSPQYVTKFPYVDELIGFLKSKGKSLMIISNKDRKLLELECDRLFLPGTFAKIAAGNEAPKDKPFAEHAYYTLEGFLHPDEISPEKVWLVGDSKFDVNCAINAGALPVLIGENPENDEIIYFDSLASFYKAFVL